MNKYSVHNLYHLKNVIVCPTLIPQISFVIPKGKITDMISTYISLLCTDKK